MPTENPTPPSIFAEIESALPALHIYGAAGIAALGWAMGWLLETAARPWVPLWFCGGLLIDNADRLRRDPADAVNAPARTAASARYRTASRIALTLAALRPHRPARRPARAGFRCTESHAVTRQAPLRPSMCCAL